MSALGFAPSPAAVKRGATFVATCAVACAVVALEAHYRRNVAHIVPQPQPEPMRVIRNDQRIRLLRVELAAETRWRTGVAFDHLDEWDREVICNTQ